MPLVYRIYGNDGQGGEVNYSSPITTSSGLSFLSQSLNPSSDNWFAVRAYDPATDLEEANTEARVRIILGPSGIDMSNVPNPPQNLTTRLTAGGGCRVSWATRPSEPKKRPTGFYVYLSPGPVPIYDPPTATVAYVPGQLGYSCNLSGLSDSVTYTVSIRSYNAVGCETNTSVWTSVVGNTTPPTDVVMLIASTI
jgi:hypothetical protein